MTVQDESLTTPSQPEAWQQGELVELTITDLSNSGDGVGRYAGRAVFVPDTVVGDRLLARLVRVKPQFAQGKLHQLLGSSPHRIRPHCIVSDKCGGCQWQHIDYEFQRQAKRNLVIQDLQRIGGFSHPPVDPLLLPVGTGLPEAAWEDIQTSAQFASPHPSTHPPIHPSTHPRFDSSLTATPIHSVPELVEGSTPTLPHLAYRNKVTYPLQRSQSGQVQAGYYQKGSHHLVNLNQCPIQDQRLNPLLAEVKQDIQRRGWQIYDEQRHNGELRHLGLRIGRSTGEILLTLVAKQGHVPNLNEQAQEWLARYPALVGVCLNVNPQRGNAIFGSETRLIAGQSFLTEIFLGFKFQIHPTTFFQVYTEQAEALVAVILQELNLQGTETIVDAYCGIGTMTLPLAQQARQAIALELQPEAVQQAHLNAEQNGITNITFHTGAVEDLLPTLAVHPDIVLLDPPRKGCDAAVIQSLLAQKPNRIVYVSCNPATLARDLKLLCADGDYELTRVQPADFFPQTSHVECAAFLSRR